MFLHLKLHFRKLTTHSKWTSVRCRYQIYYFLKTLFSTNKLNSYFYCSLRAKNRQVVERQSSYENVTDHSRPRVFGRSAILHAGHTSILSLFSVFSSCLCVPISDLTKNLKR